MATSSAPPIANPIPQTVDVQPHPADLDALQLVLNHATQLKPVPPASELRFGQNMSDHMLLVSYDAVGGWSAPEIKSYGPLTFDPASLCLQYGTTAFEGMKAYMGPGGEVRLFRPEKNMARLARSAALLALPRFDTDELLKLIKALLLVDRRWVPTERGHSLYIRPMLVRSRVLCAPTGPYFRTGVQPLSLLSVPGAVRAWPGGTGAHKVAVNYGPTLAPQQTAQVAGYDQTLWVFEDRITEAGVMNFVVALRRGGGVSGSGCG